MARNTEHALQLELTADEAGRQRFALALKRQLESMRPKVADYYQQQIAKELTQPNDREQITRALYQDNSYQALACMRRQAQLRMWQSVARPLQRQRQQLQQQAADLTTTAKGSLTLDPELAMPPAMQQFHVHLQPGGYCLDQGPDDIDAGVFYEAGGAIYSQGQGVGTAESKAEMVIRHLRQRQADFKPLQIVDLACSAGASTLPYAQAFPAAEVYGIDTSAAMLRYAHAKAESVDLPIHFRQQDVRALDFADNSVDLVVSHNALHELSSADRQAMFAECQRILKPGGICLHQDVPLRFDQLPPFWQAEYSFDQWFNGEVYWCDYAESDCLQQLQQAGFSNAEACFWAQKDRSFKWYVLFASKVE